MDILTSLCIGKAGEPLVSIPSVQLHYHATKVSYNFITAQLEMKKLVSPTECYVAQIRYYYYFRHLKAP
jgi:hypothetical protein